MQRSARAVVIAAVAGITLTFIMAVGFCDTENIRVGRSHAEHIKNSQSAQQVTQVARVTPDNHIPLLVDVVPVVLRESRLLPAAVTPLVGEANRTLTGRSPPGVPADPLRPLAPMRT